MLSWLRKKRTVAKRNDPAVYDFLRGLEGDAQVADGCCDDRTYSTRPAYQSAGINKFNAMWQPEHRSGDAAINESWSLTTARIRDAVRNDPVCRKAWMLLKRLVIGPGLLAFADAEDAAQNEIEDFNLESDTWFERWAEEECDLTGDQSLYEMQQQSFGDIVETGNSLWLKVMLRRRNRSVQLAYQLLEWEQLCRDRDRDWDPTTGTRIYNGIEYNQAGEKIAYHVYDAHPYETGISSDRYSVTRIPASRILHNYIAPRPSATCGISWFTALVMPSRDVDWYLGNELTSAAIDALMVAIHKSKQVGNLGSLDADGKRNDPFKWGYASVVQIPTEDCVEVVDSRRPNSNAAAFIEMMNTRISQSAGLSLNRLQGDASKANLATIKATNQDDAKMVEPVQRHQARRLAARIRRAHTESAIAIGLYSTVSAEQYIRQRWRFDSLVWVTPGTGAVQDVEEAEGAIDRMRSGMSTFAEECHKRGVHWKRNIRQMDRINRYAAKHGVVLDWTKGQGGAPTNATSAVAGPAAQEAEAA